mmetsp:Transcript_7873/g.25033  ORF Transcript_7873/g.25033 Transcript_7873/m.25033 type:complete len:208 (-) Transcript_7873:264-887(-)
MPGGVKGSLPHSSTMRHFCSAPLGSRCTTSPSGRRTSSDPPAPPSESQKTWPSALGSHERRIVRNLPGLSMCPRTASFRLCGSTPAALLRRSGSSCAEAWARSPEMTPPSMDQPTTRAKRPPATIQTPCCLTAPISVPPPETSSSTATLPEAPASPPAWSLTQPGCSALPFRGPEPAEPSSTADQGKMASGLVGTRTSMKRPQAALK